MALLQIAEPGQSAAPHERKIGIGIDLGTTNSLVSAVQSGKADTIPNENGEHILPSVVQYRANEVIVGSQAKQNAQADAVNTIVSVKRFVGRSVQDVTKQWTALPYDFKQNTGSPVFNTAGGEKNPIEVSADILRSLRVRAEQTFKDDITGAVITVPAYFDDAQRQGTKDAAQLAGLNVLRLLNEPTAAAIAYGLDQQQDGTIAVFDLGGGTFDVSILKLEKGVFEVKATAGDTALGGDDFDYAIAKYATDKLGLDAGSEKRHHRALMNAAKSVKEALTTHNEAALNVTLDSNEYSVNISRVEFEELIVEFISRTTDTCKRALQDADMSTDDIQQVVLVGGSTRVPLVRQAVESFFEAPPLTNINPDKVVAIGAGIQADILVGNKPDSDMLLLDVLPLSLGIETMGGLIEKIIPRNTTIPVARAQEFTTFKDGQTAMMVHVLQGERELVEHCRSLAKFDLTGMPALAAGAAHIRVTFQVDADGLLSVTAMEKSTGVQAHIEVKPSYGLEESEILNMLSSSMKYAKEDMQTRMLKEQQVEAKRVLESMHAALQADGDDLLNSDERNLIDASLTSLAQSSEQNDINAIKEQIVKVDALSQAFANRRMDKAIKSALAGQSVDNI